MITFKVWLATETLLYLPIYALGDMGILARVASTAELGDVTLEIKPAPGEGDVAAIEHMLEQAASAPSSEVHIAIADAVAGYSADKKGKNVLLLGAFLKRPPFWVAGRDVPKSHGEIAHRYIYYTEKYDTGHYLGQQLSADLGPRHKITCAMGEEFERYLEEPEDIPGRLRIITADLSGLIACKERDPSVHIQSCLAEDYCDFLTTGILTSRKHERDHARALAVFLEAVRSSCVLLRTAEKPAAALIQQLIQNGKELGPALAELPDDGRLDAEALSQKIAAQIFVDHVYSDTLEVEFAEWRGTVNSRHWKDKRDALRAFGRIYEPRPSRALTGDWLIRTFQDYGRFVQQVRILKGGLVASLVALAASQTLLRVFEQATATQQAVPHAVQYMSFTSALFAVLAVAWGLVALLRHRTRTLLKLQILLQTDAPTTIGLVSVILSIMLTPPIYLAGMKLFHFPVDVSDVILWGVPASIGLMSAVFLTWWVARHA
jgi:hypothetical protein